MTFLRKMFGKRESLDDITRIRTIIDKFIEASFIPLGSFDRENSAQGMTVLLYMFGAVDMLCQVHNIEEKLSLSLYENLLKEELGEYNAKEAQVLLSVVIQASAASEGQQMMKEGAEALQAWLTGVDVAAPHRLTEILMDKMRRGLNDP